MTTGMTFGACPFLTGFPIFLFSNILLESTTIIFLVPKYIIYL